MQLQFLVQGSESKPYVVEFSRTENHLRATCTCRAGSVGQYCKHRFNLLSGEVTGLVSENSDDVNKLPAMLASSDVKEALDMVIKAEADFEEAKKKLQGMKHRLARIMTSTVLLLVGIAGTGIKAGDCGDVVARQENGAMAGEQGTTLARQAVLVRLVSGGEVWMRLDEVEFL